MTPKPIRLLLTCEHGGHRVPRRYERLFRGRERQRASHRGHDAGALALARRLASALNCRFFFSTTTRLLVDLNRSPGSRNLLSDITRRLSGAEKAHLLATHYSPYRNAVEAYLHDTIARGDRALHIAVHSFTPRLRGVVRTADIGLLYDSARRGEREFCRLWQRRLAADAPRLTVRRNYPYRGTADGFPTWLRRAHRDADYLGIELEVNRRSLASSAGARRITTDLLASLRTVVGEFAPAPRFADSGPPLP